MRKWMLTMIAGAAITLVLAPDPAAARAAGFRGAGYVGGYRAMAFSGRYYNAYGYYGYRNRGNCLGGRDGDGVPCRY
jgi:hypothetical protein